MANSVYIDLEKIFRCGDAAIENYSKNPQLLKEKRQKFNEFLEIEIMAGIDDTYIVNEDSKDESTANSWQEDTSSYEDVTISYNDSDTDNYPINFTVNHFMSSHFSQNYFDKLYLKYLLLNTGNMLSTHLMPLYLKDKVSLLELFRSNNDSDEKKETFPVEIDRHIINHFMIQAYSTDISYQELINQVLREYIEEASIVFNEEGSIVLKTDKLIHHKKSNDRNLSTLKKALQNLSKEELIEILLEKINNEELVK